MAEELDLVEGFARAAVEEWRALAEKDLAGEAFDRKLRSKTHEGITLEPLYTRAQLPGAEHAPGYPGVAPFTRGARALGRPGGWEAAVEVHWADVAAHDLIGHGLERDATAIVVRCDPDDEVAADALATLLRDTRLTDVAVWFEGAPAGAAAAFAQVAVDRHIATAVLRGGHGADPLGQLAARGQLSQTLPGALRAMAELTAWSLETTPAMRAITVSTQPYHEGGATAVEELAFAMATAVEYLRELEEQGTAVADGARQIAFSYAVSGQLFMEMAKLRAARLLWAKVLKASRAKLDPEHVCLLARTSRRTKSRRDPWANVLRATGEGFAAVCGGADVLVVSPLDEAIGAPDELARRVALNTHLILRSEAHLGEVVDPAGGSFYVEALTLELAREAWQLFQDIENHGGMAKAVGSGLIGEHMGNTRRARQNAIARRKDPIVGVSEFPMLDEKPLRRPRAPGEPLEWLHRDATAFEGLRDRADALVQRPRVSVVNRGAGAARVAFARGFFEAGGFAAAGADGAASAEVAVICAPDEAYAALVPAAVAELKAAGARFVALAVKPTPEQEAAWRAGGVDLFVHLGADVPAALGPILDDLETK